MAVSLLALTLWDCCFIAAHNQYVRRFLYGE